MIVSPHIRLQNGLASPDNWAHPYVSPQSHTTKIKGKRSCLPNCIMGYPSGRTCATAHHIAKYGASPIPNEPRCAITNSTFSGIDAAGIDSEPYRRDAIAKGWKVHPHRRRHAHANAGDLHVLEKHYIFKK